MFTCPANHASETPEFCSVCGLEIPGPAPAATSVSAPATAVETAPLPAGEACPDCGAPRESDRQVFCEVCGYNFVNRVAGSGPPPPYVPLPLANGPPAELAVTPVPDPAKGAVENGHPAPSDAARWELIVTVDADLYGEHNPDAPVGQPPRKFRLFDRETLVGRAGTEVRVQVPVHGDAGVSRRQVLLMQGPDGSLVLRDLNSANGTRVDGVDVLPGVDTLLRDGAAIAMGAWTAIVVRAIGAGCTS